MIDNPKIDGRIQEILRGSGLSVYRRAEVAEEFRGHLEQLTEAKRRASADEAAVEAALAAFGHPDKIRQGLRWRQRRQEHRQVLRDMRQRLRLLLITAGILPALFLVLGIVCRDMVPLLIALAFYPMSLVGGFLVLYTFLLARIRAAQRLPAEECHPVAAAFGWFVVFVLVSALFEAVFTGGSVALMGSFAAFVPHPDAGEPMRLGRFAWDAVRIFVAEAGVLLLILSAVLAIVVAGVQRWRCVKVG